MPLIREEFKGNTLIIRAFLLISDIMPVLKGRHRIYGIVYRFSIIGNKSLGCGDKLQGYISYQQFHSLSFEIYAISERYMIISRSPPTQTVRLPPRMHIHMRSC